MSMKMVRKSALATVLAGAFTMGLAPAWSMPAAKVSGSSDQVIKVSKKIGENDMQYRQRCFVTTNKDKNYGYYKC